MATIYWTCTRETTDAVARAREHRRLDATVGDTELSRRMFEIWRVMCAHRRARERVVIRIWEDRRLLHETVANDPVNYPRDAFRYLRVARQQREVDVT